MTEIPDHIFKKHREETITKVLDSYYPRPRRQRNLDHIPIVMPTNFEASNGEEKLQAEKPKDLTKFERFGEWLDNESIPRWQLACRQTLVVVVGILFTVFLIALIVFIVIKLIVEIGWISLLIYPIIAILILLFLSFKKTKE